MRRTPTITTYSTRGGSGKTLISVNLAQWFAEVKGQKTVIIDADIEAPSIDKIFKTSEDCRGSNRTWVHYLDNYFERIDDAILPTTHENLFMVVSPPPEIGKRFLATKKTEWWSMALKRSIVAQKRLLGELGFDWIIFDNQSGLSMNSVNHMALADKSLLVLRPANYGVDATLEFLQEMVAILQTRIQSRRDYFIWNQVPKPQNEKEEDLLERFLGKWDQFFIDRGVRPTVRIPYVHSLAIELLNVEAGIFAHIPEFYQHIEKIGEKLLNLED